MARLLRQYVSTQNGPSARSSEGDLLIDLAHLDEGTYDGSSAVFDPDPPVGRHPLTRAQLYTIHALPINESRSIRVLDLDAAPRRYIVGRSKEAPLAAKLRVVSLATSPQFTALSYVWGTDSPDMNVDYITIDGSCRLKITPNCRKALTALRNKFGAITIWVDAICINQQDIEERSRQVQLMEEIYSWAKCTYVWMGSGDIRVHRAISCLNEQGKRCLTDEIAWFSDGSKRGKLRLGWAIATTIFLSALFRPVRWISFLGKKTLEHDSPSAFDESIAKFRKICGFSEGFSAVDMDAFFGQTWFQRVWTFQEFILSESLVLVYDDITISHRRLMGAIERIHHRFGSYVPWNVSAQYENLVTIWMYINRPTHWNNVNEPIRKKLPKGTSLTAYQQKAFDQFFGKYWVNIMLYTLHQTIFVLTLTCVFMVPVLEGAGLWSFNPLLGSIYMIVFGVFPLWYTWWFDRIADGWEKRVGTSIRFGIMRSSLDAKTIYLSGIIHAIRNRDVTNPLDRSYAVHGVLSRLNITLSRPDYTKSRGRVYQDLLTNLVRWNAKMVNLIMDAGATPKFSDAPSWVPDWNEAKDHVFFDQDRLYGRNGLDPTWRWTPVVKVEGNVLEVSGVCVDTIAFSSGKFAVVSNDGKAEQEVRDQTTNSISLAYDGSNEPDNPTATENERVNQPIQDDEFVEPRGKAWANVEFANKDALWDALFRLASRILYARRDANDFYWSTVTGLEGMSSFDKAYRVLRITDPRILESSPDNDEEHRQAFRRQVENDDDGLLVVSLMRKYVDQILSVGRTVFATRDGYVGTGPTRIDQGDRIALIAGVGVPMVLRENELDLEGNKRYIVIGPANIPGYMNGEIEEVEVDLETISLI
ncbi:heterokaryon incompatibility protein-domain-containing protein [Phyllosticta capitalensis]